MANDTGNLVAEVAELKAEVRFLKIIVPSACGFIALVIAVFWGIESQKIGKRVSDALDEIGVRTASQEAIEAKNSAISSAGEIQDILKSLSLKSIRVLSVDHAQGAAGQYFNFDVADLDSKLGNQDWHNNNFTIINLRSGEIGAAVLWRDSNGGSVGDGHGRFADSQADQWQLNDTALILSFSDL